MRSLPPLDIETPEEALRRSLRRRRMARLFAPFIRQGTCRDQNDLLRARLLVTICFSSAVTLAIAVGLLVALGAENFDRGSHWIYLSFGAPVIAPLAVLRFVRSLSVAVGALSFGIFINLMVCTYHLGGTAASTFPALAVVPVLGALLAGRAQGALWSVAVVAAWSGFLVAELGGCVFPDVSPAETRSLTRTLALIPTALTIFVALLIFETLNAQLRTQLSRERALFEHMAGHDPLTQIANRRSFLQHLDLGVARAVASQRLLAVMMLDLNGFKAVNDELGHPAGDALLRILASRLRRGLRETDRVARIGGDEFGILLQDCVVRADVELVARKVAALVAQPVEIRGRPVRVAAAIGVSLLPLDGTQAEALIERADTAMYRCKEEQGSGVVFSADLADGPEKPPLDR